MLLLSIALVGACQEQDPPPDSASDPGRAEVAIDMEVPPLQDELATIYRLIQQDETGSARIRLRNWMEANGEDARALFLFGLAYQREKRYAPAADWYVRATQAQPVYPPTWHFLGWSRYYLGQPRLSEEAFHRHLQMAPGEADSAYGLGLVMLDDARLDDAQSLFTRSVELLREQDGQNESRAKALFRLAEIQELRGDDARARSLLERALAASDRNEEAWFRLIQVCRRLGDEPAAMDAENRHRELVTQSPHGARP